jgi:hypothetical protein
MPAEVALPWTDGRERSGHGRRAPVTRWLRYRTYWIVLVATLDIELCVPPVV